MTSKLKGVITALITPFKKGEVDWNSFRRVLHDQLEQGVDGFVINGTTGESPTLSFDEVKRLFEMARGESGGRAALIVGTGSNSTAKAVELTRKVSEWKPDAVLSVVPYYNRPPQRGLVQHFTAVAQVSAVPVVLYNVPGRTVADLLPETAAELSAVDKIVGIKDATGKMDVLGRMKAHERKPFVYLSGDDGTCVDFCARGGHGVIAVASHIIGLEMGEAIEQAQAGDRNAVSRYQETYADLMKWLYCEANPIPVKKALHLLGLIDSAEMRLPLMELDPKFHKDLEACLRKLGKI